MMGWMKGGVQDCWMREEADIWGGRKEIWRLRIAARVLHDRQASQIVLSEIRQALLEVALCGACAGYFNLASLKGNRFRVVFKGREEGRGGE